jgi:CRP-like cAMP-binding protein
LRHPAAPQSGYLHPEVAEPVIRNSRLLRRLTPSQIDEVLRVAVYRQFPARAVIAEQNGRADRLFLLVTGSARYFFITPDGKKASLFWLMPGDAFGGACLLTDQSEYLVSTEATSQTRVLVWQRDAIRALAARYTILLENGLSLASDYLVWYQATHLSLITDNARKRLADVLLKLARKIGQKHSDGIKIEITNEQLASAAHLTHFTVSRLLSEWQRNGLLSKKRGGLLLCSPEMLFLKPPKPKAL